MTTSQKTFRQLAPLAIIALFGLAWLCADVSLTLLVDNHVPTRGWPYAHSAVDFFFAVLALRTIQWSRRQPPEEQLHIFFNALCAIAASLGIVGMLQVHILTPPPSDHSLWSVDDEWFFGNLAAFTSMLTLVLGHWFLRLIEDFSPYRASQPPS
jgi:hypothetical protein